MVWKHNYGLKNTLGLHQDSWIQLLESHLT